MDSRNEGYEVRRATPGDSPGIARVQVDSMRQGHRGVLTDEFLDALSYKQQYLARVEQMTNPEPGSFTLVATDPFGWIVGYADAGIVRDGPEGIAAELFDLNVAPKYQGLGLGKRLFAAVVRELAAAERMSMLTRALSETKSRGFYDAFGGRPAGEHTLEIGGAPVNVTLYLWEDLAELAAQAEEAGL